MTHMSVGTAPAVGPRIGGEMTVSVWEGVDQTGWIDLGSDHWLEPIIQPDGTPYGWYDHHVNPQTKKRCEGAVPRRNCRPGMQGWDVLSEEPLTLAPSLLCQQCGDHGWVRDGKWQPS
jgi:hypothetical protein